MSKKRGSVIFALAEGEECLTKKESEESVIITPELKKARERYEAGLSPLSKSILNTLNGPGKNSIERLAFESDPSIVNQYQALYRLKLRLIPDTILKRIIIQDDLVASIVQARQNHVSSFGRPRPDRFSTGFELTPLTGIVDKLDEEQKKELDRRIDDAVKKFSSCGNVKGWEEDDQLLFSSYLSQSTRNAIGLGRIATEIIWVDQPDGTKKFHSFRPIDVGTIYRATPQRAAADVVRKQAATLLQQLRGKRLIPEKFQNDEYKWVQVIEGKPVQAFTASECRVCNFYQVPDIELDGYPVTPLDTVITAVTTHINITVHNKLYFQSGRASRGMIVIKSDSADQNVLKQIKTQFNASINSVNSAWRMPVFACPSKDEIAWTPIDQAGSRDAEFQYLTDQNARVILSAFQMSPEELPGWSYLSRGTNSQALSESNSEYKLEAARDLGIRPLLSRFEEFVNSVLFPLIDENLAKICQFRFIGLDSDNAEKEAVRLGQDQSLHMTYNQVLERVEKRPISKELCGDFPLNPAIQAVLDKYVYVGIIKEKFLGEKDASKNPEWQYVRDPFYFQWAQLRMAMQQASAQAQQPQQGPQDPQAPSGGAPQSGGENPGGISTDTEQPQAIPQQASKADLAEAGNPQPPPGKPASGKNDSPDLTRSIDQAIGILGKTEKDLPPSTRRALALHKKTVNNFLEGFKEDLKGATKEILEVAEHFKPVK
jgi:hypothetical protein